MESDEQNAERWRDFISLWHLRDLTLSYWINREALALYFLYLLLGQTLYESVRKFLSSHSQKHFAYISIFTFNLHINFAHILYPHLNCFPENQEVLPFTLMKISVFDSICARPLLPMVLYVGCNDSLHFQFKLQEILTTTYLSNAHGSGEKVKRRANQGLILRRSRRRNSLWLRMTLQSSGSGILSIAQNLPREYHKCKNHWRKKCCATEGLISVVPSYPWSRRSGTLSHFHYLPCF